MEATSSRRARAQLVSLATTLHHERWAVARRRLRSPRPGQEYQRLQLMRRKPGFSSRLMTYDPSCRNAIYAVAFSWRMTPSFPQQNPPVIHKTTIQRPVKRIPEEGPRSQHVLPGKNIFVPGVLRSSTSARRTAITIHISRTNNSSAAGSDRISQFSHRLIIT